MGLVDYSDSESDTEIVAKPAPPKQQPTAGGSKKPFQKVIDRSKSGKILVNLPGSSSGRDDSNAATGADEPPAKRARISKGGAFSGFNSFLPPPKNVGKKPAASTAGSSSSSNSGATKGANAPRPGVHLKTGAAPGFIRGGYEDPNGDVGGEEGPAAGGSGKAQQPTIPAGQKPAEEVELVGKPLMFRPLSVSRKKPTKKAVSKATATTPTTSGSAAAAAASTPAQTIPTVPAPAPAATANAEPPQKKKKISLFSIPDKPTDEPAEPGDGSSGSGAYEPLIDTDEASTADAFAAYDAQYRSYAAPAPAPAPPSSGTAAPESLDSIASGMNLSAAARRELFGRRGVPPGGGGGGGGGTGATTTTTTRVISFDTEKEYAHNEALRASGEQQAHNPLRAIAPGKHSLRQLVAQVQNQRDALEESFAKGKAKQGDAASRYGWR